MTHPGALDDLVERLIQEQSARTFRAMGWMRLFVLGLSNLLAFPLWLTAPYPNPPPGYKETILLDYGVCLVAFAVSAVLLRAITRGHVKETAYLSVALDYGMFAIFLHGSARVSHLPATLSPDLYLIYLATALQGFSLRLKPVLLANLACVSLTVMAIAMAAQKAHGVVDWSMASLLLIFIVMAAGASVLNVTRTRHVIRQAAETQAEATRVRGVLARYVSEQVASTVLQEGGELGSGRRQHATLMFTDIRGFTNMSEQLPPERVVSILNAYFSRMVDVLFQYDGMLDKYIGDGMMAVFGAPVPHDDHAWRAVQAAIAMRTQLEAFNGERVSQGEAPLKIGIGIHTGECVVGNIGTERRLDYTAIGDTVNTASRIEGMTKDHGVDILMSAETLAEVRDRVIVRAVPGVHIRGKAEPIDLYVLEGLVQRVPEAAVLS
jgi:class 3 adenylate cyclase